MNTCRLPFLEVISFLNFFYLTVMSSGYLLEAQIHNASQLEAWCIHFIATHYNAIYSQCPKPLKNLDSSTLMAIEKKRWPPPWYILEADWYQKAVQELDNEKAADKLRKSHKHVRHKRKCSCLWTSCLQKTSDALRALVKPSITCTSYMRCLGVF